MSDEQFELSEDMQEEGAPDSPFDAIRSVVVGTDDDLFAPTLSPHLNAVLEAAWRIVEVGASTAESAEVLREAAAAFREFTAAAKSHWLELRKTQDRTPVVERENRIVEENLETLGRLLENLDPAPSQQGIDALKERLRSLRATVDALFTAFHTLAADEERLPRHARAPYINEILRIAGGVLRGEFPPEVLQEKLVRMTSHWQASVDDFKVLRLGKADSVEVEEKVKELDVQYSAMGDALRAMRQALEERNRGMLEAGMAQLRDAGEIMVDFFDYLERKMQPPSMRACLRCGAENPREAKICGSCHFEMPDFSEKETASSFSFVDGAHEGHEAKMVSTNMIKLREAAEGVQSGAYTSEDFGTVLEWLEAKVEESREKLGAYEEPASFASQEERKAFQESRGLLEGAIHDMSAGLARMRQYLVDGNAGHLAEGLSSCQRGEEKFYALNTLLESLQAPAPQGV